LINLYVLSDPYGLNVKNIALDFKQWVFPGGEVGVKLSDETRAVVREEQHFFLIAQTGKPTSQDIFILLHLLDAISRCTPLSIQVDLSLPYLPYARQDRVCHTGESFGLEVFLKMLKAGIPSNIDLHLYCDDAHSDVAREISNEINLDFSSLHQSLPLRSSSILQEYGWLIFPDAGAATKVVHEYNLPFSVMQKTRTFEGVKHEKLQTVPKGRILVIDDICDGGRTFISLLDCIDRSESPAIDLYVTHGIFSNQAVDRLIEAGYSRILCCNDMRSAEEKDQSKHDVTVVKNQYRDKLFGF
jgi:ribose-phosphate pyrophosphokinase